MSLNETDIATLPKVNMRGWPWVSYHDAAIQRIFQIPGVTQSEHMVWDTGLNLNCHPKNLYLLGYDFENYQVSFHQEINRCTKIVAPTSDKKIHIECMREELSVIKPVILPRALLFDLAARRTKCSFGIVQGFITGHMCEIRGWCALCQRSMLMNETPYR